MYSDWMDAIEEGTMLTPLGDWNFASRPSEHLNPRVRVYAVRRGPDVAGESNMMVQVKNVRGGFLWLDAGWFVPLTLLD